MKPLTLYDYLRVGHVKRWHNVNTIRDQTVAEHSFMVAIIALDLMNTIMGLDKAAAESSMPKIAALLMAAIFHDMPEVVIGDPPTPAKRFMRDFTGDPEIFTRMDKALMPGVPYVSNCGGEPMAWPASVVSFVNMADKIEAAHWITENGAGKHAQIVATANWRNVEDLVEKYDTEGPDAGWYEAVNRVLMALGMRYVHKQSRITPP